MASKFNLIARIQRWMDSVPGQTFMNYAYSWGAAIVILGTLFKLTHLPGANFMLFVGMGTEVLVFFISGFDRPFSKKEEENDLDEEFDEEEEVHTPGSTYRGTPGTVIIGGIPTGAAQDAAIAAAAAGQQVVAGIQGAVGIQGGASPEMQETVEAYVQQMRELTVVLENVAEQLRHVTRDSEEMENLGRTLTAINTIYEMQLKSISNQMGNIDRVNEQTVKMAARIEELNDVYGRMVQALKVNMNPAAGNPA